MSDVTSHCLIPRVKWSTINDLPGKLCTSLKLHVSSILVCLWKVAELKLWSKAKRASVVFLIPVLPNQISEPFLEAEKTDKNIVSCGKALYPILVCYPLSLPSVKINIFTTLQGDGYSHYINARKSRPSVQRAGES